MEPTYCILNPDKDKCKGKARKNLDMLMCQDHMAEYFGLELGYIEHETETEIKFVGGFLRPVKGTFFRRNTVIFPTREFFDSVYRPEDQSKPLTTSQYKMNPAIHKLIVCLSKPRLDHRWDRRYPIEIIRNLFTNEPVNTGPAPFQSHMFRNVISHITAKKSISESQISTQSIHEYLNDLVIYDGHGQFNNLSSTNFSLCFKYILANCQFTNHVLGFEDPRFFADGLMMNVEWVPDIGLVTTEDIGHVNFLVVHGSSVGSQIYYNAKITSVSKEIVARKFELKDLPSQYALSNAFRGGSDPCLI